MASKDRVVNGSLIKMLFGATTERPTFKPRQQVSIDKPLFPVRNENETEIEEFELISDPYEFMFNDFESIDTEISFDGIPEAPEITEEETEAFENSHFDENFLSDFPTEKEKSREKKSICEKLKYKNPGRFSLFYLFQFSVNDFDSKVLGILKQVSYLKENH